MAARGGHVPPVPHVPGPGRPRCPPRPPLAPPGPAPPSPAPSRAWRRYLAHAALVLLGHGQEHAVEPVLLLRRLLRAQPHPARRAGRLSSLTPAPGNGSGANGSTRGLPQAAVHNVLFAD